jgi:hypothetical protein
MIDAMDDFSDLFTLLVRSFLSSSVDTGKIDKLYEDQRAWYNKLRDSLAEAKYEYYFLGRKAEYVLMHKVVEAMQVQNSICPLLDLVVLLCGLTGEGSRTTSWRLEECGGGTEKATRSRWTVISKRQFHKSRQ